jgi:hypothetical protein
MMAAIGQQLSEDPGAQQPRDVTVDWKWLSDLNQPDTHH